MVLKTSLWKERWYALQENFVTVGSDFFLELLADDDVLYLTDNGISSEGGETLLVKLMIQELLMQKI